ncbi:hypothetical protein Pla123a_39230 [Posidoniimonas polymericola]|uniref:Uncharacterized protein n=1 Tax=Posidoniimonas polymericola TaxID=2528002 RepID=A0A5C5YD00_9BACT|nr:hypothetical protein [Posidoniimonas polymericola]TWT73587.1 hypothetical protein Pla123a_39230 [Posidoniimonas polymericola]
MVRIKVTSELAEQLLSAGEPVELVDASGRMLGTFMGTETDSAKGWQHLMPELTEEEIQRRLASNEPGLTTEELKAKLQELP